MTLTDTVKAARRVGTPLIAIRTADQAATIAALVSSFNGKAPACIRWDIVQGMTPLNEPARDVVAEVAGDNPPMITGNPTECLALGLKLPPRSVLFMQNAHRILGNDPSHVTTNQAAGNLRDLFKSDGRTLILLAPSFDLPAELAGDVLMLDEPLPDAAQLRQVIARMYTAAALDDVADTENKAKAVDALLGLAAFPAEQATAMSLSKAGVDVAQLWDRKRQMINAQPGLSVWRGPETFAGIGGMVNIKAFLSRVIAGQEAPRAIVFIDEIEKAIGTGGDTSGVSQSLLGTLLTYMQDNRATGIICIGPPGTSKSMLAKAAGNEAAIPTIAFDLSGMKASLVGESETRLRNALKVVSAVSQGRTLFIATCNSIAVLPPELRRRFTFGTFFFDLPDAEERQAIWSIYTDLYDIEQPFKATRPRDDGWTGAEIRQCCELSHRLRCTLTEAAAYIVPVARSAAQQIDALRTAAHGRFISASYPGLFDKDRKPAPAARAIATED